MELEKLFKIDKTAARLPSQLVKELKEYAKNQLNQQRFLELQSSFKAQPAVQKPLLEESKVENQCVLCDQPGQPCKECHSVFYCGKKHRQ